MLISLGKSRRDGSTGVVDLFAECHQRIRYFLGLAIDVGASVGSPADAAVNACSHVERYLVEALPLHVADEEETVLPRLLGLDARLDEALQSMSEEHLRHRPKIEALVEATKLVRGMPVSAHLRARLRDAATTLQRDFYEHLALEESVIFPAVRDLLGEAAQAQIRRELRSRRDDSHA